MVRLWTMLLIAGAAACFVAWVVLSLREKRLSPVQGVRKTFRNHPKCGKVVLGFVFCGLFVLCAMKPQGGGSGNGEQGTGNGGTNNVQMVGGGLEGNANVANVEMLPTSNTNAQFGNGNMETGILHSTFSILHSNGVPVVAGTISAEDCAAGYVLSAVRTGETHSFEPPPDAVVCEDWLTFGAARDWFSLPLGCWALGSWLGKTLRANSFGLVEALPDATNRWIAPLAADLGIVPQSRWHLVEGNGEWGTGNGSQFWHFVTPSNTLQLTWLNALFDRDPSRPVSFQCEVSANGDVEFRYDLSALADDVISNVTVGVSCGGGARTLGALARSVTSLRFARLDPFDAMLPDRDGDGISTVDEVFLHHTDPGNPDTDFDGISDSDEIDVWHTDPTNPHTLRPDMPDGMAVRIGGENPWACPEGSTNTIWEHVFYSGTTNGAFAYPQPNDSTAVLTVTVSGEGSGELVVGGTVVPLLAPPQMRSGTTSSTLMAPVQKGVTHPVYMRADGSLSVTFDSGQFAFGILPDISAGVWTGRINFPNTKAPEACVHHLETRTVAVSLPMSADAEALTCEWTGGDGVEAHNHPPRSATLEGEFSPSAGATFPYSLDHPDYLFGAKSHEQRVRFCPRPDPDPGENEGDVLHCGCVAGCGCGGECEPGYCMCDDPTVNENPEYCQLHEMPIYECEHLHGEGDDPDYDEASVLPQMMGVLPLRVPTYHAQTLHIDVPSGDYTPCCPCPSHAANHTDVAFLSHRLSVVGQGGVPFRTATSPCDVHVGGVAPSCVVGDAQLLLATNGAVSADLRYTVFGVGISSAWSGVDLAALNVFAPDFGLPVAPGTNAPAASLNLDLNVKLTHGRVRLSFENANCRFLAMAEIGAEGHRHWAVIADSATRPVLDMSITAWRRMFGKPEGEDFSVPVAVMAAGTGTCDVKFTYWTVVDGAFAEDSAVQHVTAVPPPLLADITRDGLIDAADILALVAGRLFRYWINEDTDKGDYVGHISGSARNASDLVVNGRLDLVNLFPVKLDLKPFIDAWGNAATFKISAPDGSLHFCGVNVSPSAVNMMQTENVTTKGTSSSPLHAAALTSVTNGGVPIVHSDYLGSGNEPGVLAFEAVNAYGVPKLSVMFGGTVVLEFELPLSLSSVQDMYRWLNIRSVCGDNSGGPSSFASPWNFPDAECDGTHFVFVHGYNVNPTQARAWANAMFKRLWWSGSKSRFTAVDWRGDESQAWEGFPLVGGESLDYYANVRNAFMSAPALEQSWSSLPGTKTLLAHSLGNMLVSSAIKDCGLTSYAKYYMLNAAVPMEAYDVLSDAAEMVDSAWSNVPLNYRASGWSTLFTNNDFRASLSWRGRFAGIQNAVNCYSTTEDILENPTLHGVGGWWARQELFKGTSTLNAINALSLGTLDIACEGGWGINTYYALNPTVYVTGYGFMSNAVSGLTRDDVITHPLFTPFRSEDSNMHSTNLFIVADETYGKNLRAKFLGDAIPARSFSMGANNVNGMSENYPMIPSQSVGWPRSQDEWRHSDIKEVSYFYVHHFYDFILQGDPPNAP